MFRKSRNFYLATVLTISFALPLTLARADIITDIEQLEKKPEKKKELQPKAKAARGKAAPVITETPEPIPEPADELLEPPMAQPLVNKKKSKGKTKEQRQKSPIHLKSDGTSTYSRDRSVVVLQKNVLITQDDMRLESDEAKVSLLPNGGSRNGVKSAVLEGKVAISRESADPSERMNAKSDKAVFDNLAQVVTLDGNAKLWLDDASAGR